MENVKGISSTSLIKWVSRSSISCNVYFLAEGYTRKQQGSIIIQQIIQRTQK
jgi:hypothetical protein